MLLYVPPDLISKTTVYQQHSVNILYFIFYHLIWGTFWNYQLLIICLWEIMYIECTYGNKCLTFLKMCSERHSRHVWSRRGPVAYIYIYIYIYIWGTRWRSWWRHCATSRKIAGSIPDGVIGIFHWHNPSGRTIALASTQPLTEMSTRNISWG